MSTTYHQAKYMHDIRLYIVTETLHLPYGEQHRFIMHVVDDFGTLVVVPLPRDW